MIKPLISYVITAYNIEKYIKVSIECAFAQTYSPLEIVLSDDCSTDRTFEIMKNMAENYEGPHKIVLNRNEVNLGITKHMNKAYLELAHGEIIIAAHGDDISLPERTQLSWEYLSSHKGCTSVSSSLQAIDSNGSNIEDHSAIVRLEHNYSFNSGGNIPAPSRAFYKYVMERFGPLNDDCPTEDELISFRSLMLGTNAFLPQIMVFYRKHEGSMSNPSNFTKFPLEKILKQQDDDMIKAVSFGLISEIDREKKYKQLKSMMLIRKKYRIYFASRKLKDLLALVLYYKVPFRRKLSYMNEHFLYLKRKHYF